MFEKQRDQNVYIVSPGCDLGHKHELVDSFGHTVQKIKQFVDSFPLETMYSLLLLVSYFWLIGMTVNARDCGSREINVYINSVIATFIMVGQFVVMHQVFTIHSQWVDSGQVGRQCPHLIDV